MDDAELADVPTITLPELFVRGPGRRVVSLLAEALAGELDIEMPNGARS